MKKKERGVLLCRGEELEEQTLPISHEYQGVM